MNAKEYKGLALAAAAVILLGQPALARGGGFGGGFGGGYGGSHGFGAMGVHGFNGGYSPSTHGEGKYDFGEQGDRMSNDKPVENQTPNNGNHANVMEDNGNHNNDNITNNFNGNHNWAANHPYEAAGAFDYASHHNYPYGGYNYAAYPYGYYGGVGVFPEVPLVIDNTTTQQSTQSAPQNKPEQQINNFGQNNAMQQAMMRERARVFAQELVGAIEQRAPQAVPSSDNANAVRNEAASITARQ